MAAPLPLSLHRVCMYFELFKDPTRTQVLLLIGRHGPVNTQVFVDYGLGTQPSVSHHLSLLRVSDMVSDRRSGKYNFYTLTDLGKRFYDVIRSLCDPADLPSLDAEALKKLQANLKK